MASPSPPTADLGMISDGKRMRMVWQPGDGDGDSTLHLVERSMNLVRGHPTWKVFNGDVPNPIIRGGKEEPPHYVYLDDLACYSIYCSGAYSNEELRKFWPWDFNHQGNIKQGRMNRGRPAYLDDSMTVFAKGKLRIRDQWHTFSGEPETSPYKPVRPKRRTIMEQQVAQEYAHQASLGIKHNDIFTETGHEHSNHSTPRSLTTKDSRSPSHAETNARGSSHIGFPHASSDFQLHMRTSATGELYHLGPDYPPQQSSPHRQPYYGAPRPRDSTPTSGLPDSRPYLESAPEGVPKQFGPVSLYSSDKLLSSHPLFKRTLAEPVEYLQNEERVKSPASSSSPAGAGINLDGASDDRGKETSRVLKHQDSTTKTNVHLHVHIAALEEKMKSLQAENELLRKGSESDKVRIDRISRERDYNAWERDHFRTVAGLLLARHIACRSDLTARVVALEKLKSSLADQAKAISVLAKAANTEIAPSAAICDGLNTIMDSPGKYMYDKGMDEEWKKLQKEAADMGSAER